MAAQSTNNRSHRSKLFKTIILITVVIIIVIATFSAISYLSTYNHVQKTQIESETTGIFLTNHTATVNDNSTTGIIVTITGNTLPYNTYFAITTTNDGNQAPKDTSILAIENMTSTGYYDVKVTSNATLTSEVTVKVTITNSNFNQNSQMYYWNAAKNTWLLVPTTFQSPNTITGTFQALDLTGTPIEIINYNSNTSPFVAPEYSWGALPALSVCFAIFALFKTRKHYSKKPARDYYGY